MKCPKCDTKNPDDSKYCRECASPLTSSGDTPEVTKTIETPAQELTRGTVFANRYEIIEELGKGGMGNVYRVYDKKIEGEVACFGSAKFGQQLIFPKLRFEIRKTS